MYGAGWKAFVSRSFLFLSLIHNIYGGMYVCTYMVYMYIYGIYVHTHILHTPGNPLSYLICLKALHCEFIYTYIPTYIHAYKHPYICI